MVNHNNTSQRISRKAGAYLGAIALGFTALLLPACNNEQEIAEDQTNTTTEDVAEAPEEVPAENAAEDTVTIRGEVEQAVDDNGLVIQSEGESVLVINTTGTPFVAPTNDIPIQATGESTQLVVADIERDYNLTLDPTLYADYENQPAIIANSLALAPTPEQIAADPNAFVDQTVAVEGEAGEVFSPSTLALYEEGWVDDVGLLVVGVDQALQSEGEGGEIQQGEKVVITGEVQPFDLPALDQEYSLGLEPDVQSEFEESYDRPVIVADEIYPSAVDE